MKRKQQIFIEYKNVKEVVEIGSQYQIAGVSNESHTIFGMMPHPERNNMGFREILDNDPAIPKE